MSMVLDNAFAHQNPSEIGWLLRKLGGMESFLEIGSAYGHTLAMMALMGMKGAKVCSIDAGLAPNELKDTLEKLQRGGYNCHLYQGDSKSLGAVTFAEKHAPFDFIFIDGDHSYEGVKADWENYRKFSKMIGFHDIAHPHHDVSKLWAEIKEKHKTDEVVLSNMGIGVVYL